MGKTITPTYRLEIWDHFGRHTQAWRGRATEKRLAEYIDTYVASLKLGGANEHLSKDCGFIRFPYKARIVHQQRNEVVVTWNMGMFEIV